MIETKFKVTELGLIPEDWVISIIADLGDYGKNNNLSRDNLSYNVGRIKNIHYGDILTIYDNYIDCAKECLPLIIPSKEPKNKFYLYSGDLIIADTAEDATVGKACEVINIDDIPVVSGLHTIVFRPKSTFAPKFLGYTFNATFHHNSLLPLMQGTKVISITKRGLKNICLAYPPNISEQEHIAEALSDADALIKQLDALIDKKRAVLQGTMQDLLSARHRLPGFSDLWIKKNLLELGSFISGNGFPLKYQGQSRGQYPFYKVSDMNNVGNETYMYAANNYINNTISESLNCNIIPKNSIIFAKIGAAIFLERKRLTTMDCCIDNNMQSFQCMDQLVPLFALWLFKTIKLSEHVSSTALPALKSSDLNKIEVFIPASNSEQEAIAEVLSDMNEEIKELMAKRDKYVAIRQGMIQQLLTGKIRLI